MGSGASSIRIRFESLRIEDKREIELEKKNFFKSLEAFIFNSYLLFSHSKSLKILLAIDNARKAIQKYLKNIGDDHYINFYLAVEEIVTSSLTGEQLRLQFEKIIHEYILCNSLPKRYHVLDLNTSMKMKCITIMKSAEATDEAYRSACQVLMKDLVDIMAANTFRGFVLSKSYHDWRKFECHHAVAMKLEDILNDNEQCLRVHKKSEVSESTASVDSPLLRGSKRRSSQSNLSFSSIRTSPGRDLSLRAFRIMSYEDLSKLLTGENWLASLMSAAEGLPFGVTVANAKSYKRGFPIIFSNKYFEDLTGYSRNEIIGRNLKFLQCKDTDVQSVRNCSEALSQKKTHTTILLNQKASGKNFKNLISMKPIISDTGQYAYVIAMSLDVSEDNDEGSARMKSTEKLMELLPSKIFLESSEF